MKKVMFVIVLTALLMLNIGCTSPRMVRGVENLSNQKEITLEVEKTVTISTGPTGIMREEAGIAVKIMNLTDEVKYINWSSSSITYNDFTTRILTGRDRVGSLNAVLPNTAIMPKGRISTTLFVADALTPKRNNSGTTWWEISPSLDCESASIILSYSGDDTNKLKQAIFKVLFETSK